jgi:hypothetical protein
VGGVSILDASAKSSASLADSGGAFRAEVVGTSLPKASVDLLPGMGTWARMAEVRSPCLGLVVGLATFFD